MAKATFHSLRGEKSALVAVKANAFVLANQFVYINRTGVMQATKKSESELEKATWDDQIVFDIPDDYQIVPMVDENGEIRTSKDGGELHTLVW